MFRTITVLILASATICCNAVVKLPENIPTCDVKSPTLNECLKTAIVEAWQMLKDGKKSLGLLSLDPLSVDKVVLDIGTPQAPFLFTAKNLKVYGLTQCVVKDLDFHSEKMTLKFVTLTPNVTFIFDYEAQGRLLVLPVNGEGPGSFRLTDMVGTKTIEGVPVMKNGRTYMDVKKFNLKIDAKKMDIHLEGLLKGNKQVSDQLSDFLNREWKVFFDRIRGPASEAFGEIFLDLSNRVFSRVPYGDVFPGADDLKLKS